MNQIKETRKELKVRKNHKCCECFRTINKGSRCIRINSKAVFQDDDGKYFINDNIYLCFKCEWKHKYHDERFEKRKLICDHPKTEEIWTYMLGEAVMEPDHEECIICQKRL
jgi:hypothetical protein